MPPTQNKKFTIPIRKKWQKMQYSLELLPPTHPLLRKISKSNQISETV